MMQDTSLETWCNAVKPQLTERQLEIYQAIIKSPNHTAAEYAQQLVRPVNTISGRFGELKDLGKIQRIERRQCNVTKGNAWTWAVK